MLPTSGRIGTCLMAALMAAGCTVKAVGDPERPITINANIKIDIKGLENTATNIEDYVSGDRASVSSQM